MTGQNACDIYPADITAEIPKAFDPGQFDTDYDALLSHCLSMISYHGGCDIYHAETDHGALFSHCLSMSYHGGCDIYHADTDHDALLSPCLSW